MEFDAERVRFVFGVEAGELSPEELADEGQRIELLERFDPVPGDSEQRDFQMAVRTVIANQILDDDPPDVWRTVQRLQADGIDRDVILRHLQLLMTDRLAAAVNTDGSIEPMDDDAYIAALDALPLPGWFETMDRILDIVRRTQPANTDDIVDEMLTTLDAHHSMSVEALVRRALDHLLAGALAPVSDERVVVLNDLIDGATFAHRFNEAEAELEVISAGFDLGAFAHLDDLALTDGTPITTFSADRHHVAWTGPDGWLSGFEAGQLLAITVSITHDTGTLGAAPQGTVNIEAVTDEPLIDKDLIEAVRAAYDDIADHTGLPVTGDRLAWSLLVDRPDAGRRAQTALPPLTELCEAVGLEQRGGQVADDENQWRRDLYDRRMERIEHEPAEVRRTLLGPVAVFDRPNATLDQLRTALDQCAEPEVMDVLADALIPNSIDAADRDQFVEAESTGYLFALVERAQNAANRPAHTAVAEYLAAVLHERCGQPHIAEQHLRRANDALPMTGPIVERLGWYCFDRGDASGAMSWWRTLNGQHPAAATITEFLKPTATATKIGRNDPCWCGSGRKFKQCHRTMAPTLPPLPERVGWLCQKANQWIEHATDDTRNAVLINALARATGSDDPNDVDLEHDDDLGEMVQDAFEDPIVIDAALHEGGLFARFLRDRADLLPDDEHMLATTWLTVDRSVHEVVEVDPGVGMTLRDLATGDETEVSEETGSRTVDVGDRICARIVPDGSGYQIVGGVFTVRTGHEADVLDLCDIGDPVELCAWVGALHAPPTITHAPGMIDEMFDMEALGRLVDGLGDDAGDDERLAVLQQELTRQAQAHWLDDHVPALDGLTPREAAADPTRREQLERLLDEFERREGAAADAPDGPAPITFDVDVLRRELGLT